MRRVQWRMIGLAGVAILALAGCGGEGEGAGTPAPQGPGSPPTSPAAGNAAPVISGAPALSVVAGAAYQFQASATDVDSTALTFSAQRLPAWASLQAQTGLISGTPTTAQIGRYDNIVISVSDGANTTSLAAFNINVTSPGTGTGTATLSWTSPTQNTDGSSLTDLAGYRVYHGTSASALNEVRTISSPGITTVVFDTLATGTHYFAIAAVNTIGVESALSGVGSKAVL